MIERAPSLPVISIENKEDAQISRMFRMLSEKYYSDEALKKLAATCFRRVEMYHLLLRLSSEFDAVCREKNYNREAQANIVRMALALIQEIYREPPQEQPVQQPVEGMPPAFVQQAVGLLTSIVRYPLYLFTRIFGSLQLAVSTFTSLDRSFWQPFFPHNVLSFMITLPIDFLFIATAVFQFQWFEVALFADTLKVGNKKQIEPALTADRTTIKVAGLFNEEVMARKELPLSDNAPPPEVRRMIDQLAWQFSRHVISKEEIYKYYKEPWQKKASRWSLNLVGAFLVCCLNAFTFKYTIAAFASSHAVSTLLPAVSALLCTPAAITILTMAAVVYGLVYYSAKRAGSPDYYHKKFILNGKKIQTFKKVRRSQEHCQKEHRDRVYQEAVNEKLVEQNSVLKSLVHDEKEAYGFRSTHRSLLIEIGGKIPKAPPHSPDDEDEMKADGLDAAAPVPDAKSTAEACMSVDLPLGDLFYDDRRLSPDSSHNGCPDYYQAGEKPTSLHKTHKTQILRA